MKLGEGEEITLEDIQGATLFGGGLGGIVGTAPEILKGGGDLPKVFKNIRKRLDGGAELSEANTGLPIGQTTPEFEPTSVFQIRGRPKGSRKGIPNNPEESAAMEAAGQTNIFKSFAADPRLGQTDDQIMDAYKAYRGKVGDPYIEPKKAFKRGW